MPQCTCILIWRNDKHYNFVVVIVSGRRVSCPDCTKSFSSSSSLYHHRKAIHSNRADGRRAYSCHLCSKQFNFHHSLKLHSLKHNGVRPHRCTTCDKTYLTASHLKCHVESVHCGDTQRFVCDDCGRFVRHDSGNDPFIRDNLMEKWFNG